MIKLSHGCALSHRSVYSTLSRTFVITENTFSISDRISSLEHVIVTMSLSIRGISTFLQYDYDDLYDYEGDLYDWLEDSHPRRGDIKIELTSPQGTKSILLPYRNYDFINAEGYNDWPFMSVHLWGENPIGTWTLKITYKSGSGYVRMSGLSMTLYGTATIPTAVSSIPSVCHSSCARGCFGEGPEHCDSCQQFRIASTLECVDQCPTPTHTYKSYCYVDDRSSTTSPTTTPTDSDEGHSTTATPTGSDEGHSTTATPTGSDEGHSTTATPTGSNEEHSTTAILTGSNEGHTTSSTVTNEEQGATNAHGSNTVPIAVGVTAGIILLALTTVILSVINIVVFLKRKRKLRSDAYGFVQLMSTEVET